MLFIDQMAPYHPDLIELGLADIDPYDYYSSIRNFLEKLNKNFGYKIEISCNPKFQIYKLKKFFPKFEIQIGKTLNQIKNSSLVVCHNSAAVNFAVIYKKPVIFITNNSLNNSAYPHYEALYTAAKLLNSQTLNIDTDSVVDITNYLKINEKAYKNYFINFIKPGKQKKFQADIIIEKIKHDRIWA